MDQERVDLLAEALIDTPFPVERLQHNAEWMLELIRERIGKLGLIKRRRIMPMRTDPAQRWSCRAEAGIEQTELRLFEGQFAARKKLATMLRRAHGEMITLRSINLPAQLQQAQEGEKDAAWENAQWVIREGVARDQADALFDEELTQSLPLQLLSRGLEDIELDPREILADQITEAVKEILFPAETITPRQRIETSDQHMHLHP